MKGNEGVDYFDIPWLCFGDICFISVKSVAFLGKYGYHACLVVKDYHSRSPNKFLEDTK